jgi:hypothetical protein
MAKNGTKVMGNQETRGKGDGARLMVEYGRAKDGKQGDGQGSWSRVMRDRMKSRG